ncbi:MAG: hypothetical protein LT067_06185 [Sulfurovum sp.]|nr:hypothetical protein [Sulfurovum sp.]
MINLIFKISKDSWKKAFVTISAESILKSIKSSAKSSVNTKAPEKMSGRAIGA